MTGILFDARSCTLGEGPLWHPERNQLFWFDIIGKKMMSRADNIPLEWQFEHHVSAAGRYHVMSSDRSEVELPPMLTPWPALISARWTRNNLFKRWTRRPLGGLLIGTMGKMRNRQ